MLTVAELRAALADMPAEATVVLYNEVGEDPDTGKLPKLYESAEAADAKIYCKGDGFASILQQRVEVEAGTGTYGAQKQYISKPHVGPVVVL